MKKFIITAVLTLVAVSSAQAMDNTSFTIGPITVQKQGGNFVSAFMGIPMTSAQGAQNDNYYKLVVAHDDAMDFVASGGQVRRVNLISALEMVRKNAPDLQASDLQIAQEIIAFGLDK